MCRNGSVRSRRHGQHGVSLIELIMVLIIVLLIAATAIPTIMSSVHTAHLRGAASDFSSLLEQARILAIRDNRYYSSYILAASGNRPQEAYVDMLPKNMTGASGNGGTSIATGDPSIVLQSDVVPEAVANAPNTSNLETQLLPATTPVTPTDTTVSPATFGPRGLPCTPLSLTGGTVCDSSGGATAFWSFFQNSSTKMWQVVTITPAGRIQKWYYNGSTWSKL
jgi:prepilin-type N-terminal cleavage/methylation domain-containing protein